MSMSLKAELETWAAALKAYDEQDFVQALDLFSRIADSAKILTNMGLIYATIGEHETAVEHFIAAVNQDIYLAIAYFQCGVSNFLLGRYDQALTNFEYAYLYLRGNEAINYEQLGLKFKLFSAEILFNKGLSQVYLGNPQEAMLDMQEASMQKVTDEHSVIDDAIKDRGEGYTVFSIPVGVLYRPSENKLKNAKCKDYLGKAKLVAASDSNDAFTEFTGVKRLQQASGENGGSNDLEAKPEAESASNLNRSATVPAPPTNPVAARPTAVERSKTTLQLGAIFPRALASRRSQSVSNPQNVPLPPLSTPTKSDFALGRNNTLRRSNSATGRPAFTRNELTRAGTPLRSVTPQGTGAGGVAWASTGGSRSNNVSSGEAGTFAGAGSALKPRSGIRRPQIPQFQEPPPVPSLRLSQVPPVSLQSRHVTNAGQGVAPFVFPGVPSAGVPDSNADSQFDDAYTDDASSPNPSAMAAPSSQFQQQQVWMQSPGPAYQQPQPQMYDTPQPAWMQTASSSNSSSAGSSGHSRTPSRAANATMNMNANMNAGQHMGMGINNAGGGTSRRKMTRRPMVGRVPVYDDDEGDDGFVTGEYEELAMAKIRVKLHYQEDVRGMMIPPTTTFEDFVARVTTKFGTSPTGLAMKFKDDEGTMITLRDESDFELAVDTAREGAKGRSEGKIEVWCVDM